MESEGLSDFTADLLRRVKRRSTGCSSSRRSRPSYLPSPAAVVIDIGSGGGSPAIPMKLVSPGSLDAHGRVEDAKGCVSARGDPPAWSSPSTTVEASSVEELLIRPELHEAADVVTVRAVRTEKKLLTENPGVYQARGAAVSLPKRRCHDGLGTRQRLPAAGRRAIPCSRTCKAAWWSSGMFHVEQGRCEARSKK